MEIIEQPGGPVSALDAPDWTGQSAGGILKIGLNPDGVVRRFERGMRNQLGQLYGIVAPGLILTQHVFEGLKRRMYVGNDHDAELRKLAATWRANRDAYLDGDAHDPRLTYREAPRNRVFVVVISPNLMIEEYPAIYGWCEHWAWVADDPNKPGAPIDSATRFSRQIWTKDGNGNKGPGNG